MAFCGHINASGDLILREEIFVGNAIIQRSMTPSDSPRSLSSAVSLPQNTARFFTVKNDTDISDKSADAPQISSPDCWSLMYADLKQSHGVPPLLLGSQSSSVNYMRNIDRLKDCREPGAAYENWYSAKRRQRMEKRKVLKEEHDNVQEQAKERKELAKMCYNQWLKDKARQAAAQRMENHMQTAALKASQSLAKYPIRSPMSSWSSATLSGSASAPSTGNKTLRNVSQDNIRKVVEEWWGKKQQQLQAEREEKRRALISKSLEQERRKELAQLAFQEWMSNVDEKPKPVPLNQGMDSLRATISPLYINPRPWIGSNKPSKI